jgi:hypothetical protein
MNISKTKVTLIVTIVIAIGNAVLQFMPNGVAGTVTAILGALAIIFHVSDVNSAVASAKAPVASQPSQ